MKTRRRGTMYQASGTVPRTPAPPPRHPAEAAQARKARPSRAELLADLEAAKREGDRERVSTLHARLMLTPPDPPGAA